MPINKIVATKRGKAAVAAMVIAMITSSGLILSPGGQPAAVTLAVTHLIKPWEGLVLKSHWDSLGKVWDICYGETKGITAGMTKTVAECDAMLKRRVFTDYYLPLTKRIKGFTSFPVSVQATMVSGAYNFGISGMVNSTAARLAARGKFREACEAQTAWNKAGGRIVRGLVNRREMGDKQRLGEAELCVSGLESNQ